MHSKNRQMVPARRHHMLLPLSSEVNMECILKIGRWCCKTKSTNSLLTPEQLLHFLALLFESIHFLFVLVLDAFPFQQEGKLHFPLCRFMPRLYFLALVRFLNLILSGPSLRFSVAAARSDSSAQTAADCNVMFCMCG